MAPSQISTAAVQVVNNTESEVFFVEGTPMNWHEDNSSRHVLVAPGFGYLNFSDGEHRADPFRHDHLSRNWWQLSINNGFNTWSTWHDEHPVAITIEEDGTWKVTTKTAVNPLWTATGRLQNGSSWTRQPSVAHGQQFSVLYDISSLPDHLISGGGLTLTFVDPIQDLVASPSNILPLAPLTESRGEIRFNSYPDNVTLILKCTLNGRVLSSQGSIQMVPKPTPMPQTAHVHSIAVAADTSKPDKYHFFAAVMSPLSRTIWHATKDGESMTWAKVDNPSQPITELEVMVMDDGRTMLFALDEAGYVHFRHNEDAWQSAPWADQLVPFIQLTTVQSDSHHVIALDNQGAWWQTVLLETWSPWTVLPTPTTDGMALLFQDIASAASSLAAVDFQGRAYVDTGGGSWGQVKPKNGGSTLPDFVAVELTKSNDSLTLWLVDEKGGIWTSINGDVLTIQSGSEAGFAAPVPLGSRLCGVTHGVKTQIWATSGLLEVWSYVQGEHLWDGPTWGGIAVASSGKLFDLSSCRTAQGAIGLYVTAAGNDVSSRKIWSGMHEAPSSTSETDWQMWNLVAQPGTVYPYQIAGAKGSANRLWAVLSDWTLYSAAISSGSDIISPVWTRNSTAPTIRRIAACSWADGVDELWAINSQGQVLRATEANQFLTFSSVAGSPLSRSITATVINNTTIMVGLKESRTPYEVVVASTGTGFTIRDPAFGLTTSVKFVQIVLGSKMSGTNELAVALGLDKDGWLWAAEQSSGSTWAGWTGPRPYNQPARFVLVEAALGSMFAVDTLYQMWAYDFATGTWDGPGWQFSLALATRAPAKGKPSTALLRSSADGSTSQSGVIFTSQRALSKLQLADGSTLIRAEFLFEIIDKMSTIAATIVGPAGGRFGYAIRYGMKGTLSAEVYPNTADFDLYGIGPESVEMFFFRGYANAVVHPVRDPNNPKAKTVRTVTGQFVLALTDTSQPKSSIWQAITAYLWQRQRPQIPPSTAVRSRRLELKVNFSIAWFSQDAPVFRTWFKNAVYAVKELMTDLYRGYGIDLKWAPGPIQEVEITQLLTTDYSRGTPTYEYLKGHAIMDAANVVFTNSLVGSNSILGITGGLSALPLPDAYCFGCLIHAWRAGNRPKRKTPNELYHTAAHELGHLLGLSHESALELESNLMYPVLLQKNKRGENLNDDQLYMIKNAVLVEEQVGVLFDSATAKVTSLHVVVKTGKDRGDGTDERVRLIVLDTANHELVNIYLDNFFYDDFEVGDYSFFEIELYDDQQFDARNAAKFSISYKDTSIFGDNWNMDQLTVTGHVGEKVKFIFQAATVPHAFNQREETWVESITPSNMTIFDVSD